jgi:putative nucleotidyltransferase with HDIG domain
MAGELIVDVPKIKKAAHNAIPLTITTYTLPHEIEVYVEEVIDVFLTELGQKRLKDFLVYGLRELAVNAKKANTKRVYFEDKRLDIGDPREYDEGMRSFKQDTMDNINYYLQRQKEKGLYIKLIFQAKGSNIVLEVRNNVEINREEYIRIHDKLARSRRYVTLEEALQKVIDPSEGAGLGLVILVLMLKKIGLSEECFDIWAEKGETVARITIPVPSTRIENMSTLTDEIVRQIQSLPQFPDNIVQIQRLIADPRSEMIQIARQMSTDPALTADLLRMVNSAQFMLPKRVDNIVEAVKLVGLRGIKNMLYSYGTQLILGDETREDRRKLWQHSNKAAYYSYNLAKNFKPQSRALLDDAYVSGMLHDIGKIVFSSAHPDLLDRIKDFCGAKGIESKVFEDMAGGMNHAEIGAKIAEKWNFPEPLVEAIRFHHTPSLVQSANKDVVYTVYLANAMCEYEVGGMTFEQFEKPVLEDFGFMSEKQFAKVAEQFLAGFKRDSQLAREAAEQKPARRAQASHG